VPLTPEVEARWSREMDGLFAKFREVIFQ
jgi:hypothetical protein